MGEGETRWRQGGSNPKKGAISTKISRPCQSTLRVGNATAIFEMRKEGDSAQPRAIKINQGSAPAHDATLGSEATEHGGKVLRQLSGLGMQ